MHCVVETGRGGVAGKRTKSDWGTGAGVRGNGLKLVRNRLTSHKKEKKPAICVLFGNHILLICMVLLYPPCTFEFMHFWTVYLEGPLC